MKAITTLILLATTTLAAAETKQKPTDQKLAQLVGRWEGTSTFTIKGKTTKWKMSTHCERTAVGPAITCTSVGVSGSMRLEEVWLLGIDVSTDRYHLFMVNNWGEAYDHVATWTDAKQVSFVHKGARDGKPLMEEYRLSFTGKQLTFYGILTIDGKPIGEGTSVVERVP